MNKQSNPVLALHAEGLTKEFRQKKKTPVIALENISLSVHAGEVTGLVGPDGAGKTTLLRLAAGLLLPTQGNISVLGLDCEKQSIEIQSRVGYMPQQFGLYQDLTVQENMDLYSDLQGVAEELRPERYEKLLQMTGLAPFTDRRAGNLSGGMKQKLGLACALIKSPEMLLLDEPTVGVDPISRRDLWKIVYQLVEEEGIGVLVATSYLDEADQCHKVIVLQDGHILAKGEPMEFREMVRGQVFRFSPVPGQGARPLQALLATKPEVLDATIRSGRVRCVMSDQRSDAIGELLPANTYVDVEACEPTFEDAFMAMAPRSDLPFLSPAQQGSASAEKEDADEVVVKASSLKKVFGDFVAVKDINFEVKRGKIFGLLGPNGAGKTTTFRMLCGLTSVSDGDVSVAGQDLRHSGAKARSRLGYMAQIFSLYRQLSVRANLEFYGKAYGLYGIRLRERIDWALDEFELRSRQDAQAGDLPGGFRQRLAMATAMLHEPAILFLDEPTSGADPLARREFWLRINGFAQQGVTVVVTTHFMEEAEYCDHMLIMSRGADLAQGTPDQIRMLAQTDDNPDPTVEDAFIALAEGRVNSGALKSQNRGTLL